VGEGFEVLETVAEGYRAGRFGFWIAVPSAELGDDPHGPGKCFRRMRVLLERGLTFECGQDCVKDFDFGGREGDPGVLPRPAIARLDELHDGASGTGGSRGQLDQPPGVFQLAVFQLQALLFQSAEELLDMPALPVAANHAPGHRRIFDATGGQKPLQDGIGAWRRIYFADLDQTDLHRLGQSLLPGQIGGALERGAAKAGHEPGGAARFGINTQHRVQQNTASRPLADLTQIATALLGRREIEFAGVLDRQNMPARAALRKLRAPAIKQRINCHARIGQKSRKFDNPTAPTTRQTPQARARAHHHSREQQTPLFTRRSSPKSPSPQLSEVITRRPPFKVGQPNDAT
jgi:hypothetical protein